MPDQQENYGGSFAQKVIWITGASSGIGEALTKIFARCGAKMVLSARSESGLQRVREECIAAGASGEDLLVIPLELSIVSPEIIDQWLINTGDLTANMFPDSLSSKPDISSVATQQLAK
jgi:NAD(P)-dependent dehydrogenase (short-subunit alcohol dehydrogenase family)